MLRSPVLIRVVRNIAYWRMVLAACDTRRCALTASSLRAPADGSAFSQKRVRRLADVTSLSALVSPTPRTSP